MLLPEIKILLSIENDGTVCFEAALKRPYHEAKIQPPKNKVGGKNKIQRKGWVQSEARADKTAIKDVLLSS